jgi:hypothetical protein
MTPKSGQAGTAVSPANPEEAKAAAEANSGEVEQASAEAIKGSPGQYGSISVKPYKPPQTQDEKEKKTSWIEIEMVNQDDRPVPGKHYRITLADGETVAEGTLDPKGFARVDGIDPGTCKVTFPDLDKDAWEKA